MQNKVEVIVWWLKKVYGARKKAVIAVSGGVDSAVSLAIVTKAIGKERVIPILLPYGKQGMDDARLIIQWVGLERSTQEVDIKPIVDLIVERIQINDRVRRGNIMARVRMIVLFDYAKKVNALVCGTENKSERQLGYYTRYGDSASDVEPINHLYKTEIWAIAKELGLPELFYTKKPTAGLWNGQTDEEELGFSYVDADRVLQGKTEGLELRVVDKVHNVVRQNAFKSEVPYSLD